MNDQEKKLLKCFSRIKVNPNDLVDIQDNGDFNAPIVNAVRGVTEYFDMDYEAMDKNHPDWYADCYAVGNSVEACVSVIYAHFYMDGFNLYEDKTIEVPKSVGKELYKKLYESSPNEFALDVIIF